MHLKQFVGCPKYSLWCLDIFLFFSCLQTGLHNLQQLNQQLKNPTFLHHSGAQELQFLPKPNTVSCYDLYVVWFKEKKEKVSGLNLRSLFCVTSNSKVRRRILVASLEAWGSVAICLVHSDTVFVSLVVRGSAALINTSAASHTYTRHKYNHVCTRIQKCCKLMASLFLNCMFFLFFSCGHGSVIGQDVILDLQWYIHASRWAPWDTVDANVYM